MTFDYKKKKKVLLSRKICYPVELISYTKPKYTNLIILRNILPIYDHKPRCVDQEVSYKED